MKDKISGNEENLVETVQLDQGAQEPEVNPTITTQDTNADGVTDTINYDMDSDGVIDSSTHMSDSDGDGTMDTFATDIDGDGVVDMTTVEKDLDGDGIADSFATDFDGDGVADTTTTMTDTDGDGMVDTIATDYDGDGIADTTTTMTDTDGDGIADTFATDYDGDGIADTSTTMIDSDGDGIVDQIATDYDGDGVVDEMTQFSDTDGDGFVDTIATDSDMDGFADSSVVYEDIDGDGIMDQASYYEGDLGEDGGFEMGDDMDFEVDDDGGFLDELIDGCFTGDMRVQTPHGYVPIREIEAGTVVLSYDARTQQFQRCQVTKAKRHSPRDTWELRLESGTSVRATANHRILTTQGWKKVASLHEGCVLITEGGPNRVRSVQKTAQQEPVYNLYTTGQRNFVIEGLVAHNFTRCLSLRSLFGRHVLDPVRSSQGIPPEPEPA